MGNSTSTIRSSIARSCRSMGSFCARICGISSEHHGDYYPSFYPNDYIAPDWNIESIYKRKAIIVKIKNPTGPLMRDLEGGYIHHEASILDNASVHMGDGDFAPVVQESRV